MSFLDNMPSRNAASFSLLVAGEAGARGQSRHQAKGTQKIAARFSDDAAIADKFIKKIVYGEAECRDLLRAQQYMALNDTRPPEGQVIGMCMGHSVLGYDWHQQRLQSPAAKQQQQPPFTRAAWHGEGEGGGSSSHGHPRLVLTSPTPPRPSPRATPTIDSTGLANPEFQRKDDDGGGGGGGSGRAATAQDERNDHIDAQGDDRMGDFAHLDQRESITNAPSKGGFGRGRGRGRVTRVYATASATTTNSSAAGLGRRRARAEGSASPPVSGAAAATADDAMGGPACSTTADGKDCDAAAGSTTEGAQGKSCHGGGAPGFRAVGGWGGKKTDLVAGRERLEARAWPIREGGKGDEGVAEEATVAATTTRGRVGMRKARRTYGR